MGPMGLEWTYAKELPLSVSNSKPTVPHLFLMSHLPPFLVPRGPPRCLKDSTMCACNLIEREGKLCPPNLVMTVPCVSKPTKPASELAGAGKRSGTCHSELPRPGNLAGPLVVRSNLFSGFHFHTKCPIWLHPKN
jgi:hypothetical protein